MLDRGRRSIKQPRVAAAEITYRVSNDLLFPIYFSMVLNEYKQFLDIMSE